MQCMKTCLQASTSTHAHTGIPLLQVQIVVVRYLSIDIVLTFTDDHYKSNILLFFLKWCSSSLLALLKKSPLVSGYYKNIWRLAHLKISWIHLHMKYKISHVTLDHYFLNKTHPKAVQKHLISWSSASLNTSIKANVLAVRCSTQALLSKKRTWQDGYKAGSKQTVGVSILVS